MRNFVAVATVVFSLVSSSVSGHAYLSSPAARDGMANPNKPKKFKRPVLQENLNGCLDTVPGPNVAATFDAGSTMTVEWTITAAHPSDPGVRVALATTPGGPFTVLADALSVNDEKVSIQLPDDISCTNCVLHWLWDSAADGGYYFGCSDIAINAAAGAAPVPAPAAPVPAPAPVVAPPAPAPVVLSPASVPSPPAPAPSPPAPLAATGCGVRY